MPAKMPIHHVSFSSHYQLSATFVRFQEHYESPKFRGKIFDLETFMDWYAGVRGSFTYLQDWGGFNIPSRVLRPFREGHFDPLSRKEQALLRMFEGLPEPFYVIGTLGTSLEALAHEFVHGMYCCRSDYAADVRKIVAKHRPTKIFRALGEDSGYDKSVFPDEANAYALTDSKGSFAIRAYPKMIKELASLFAATFGWSIRNRRNWPHIPKLIHHHRFPRRLHP